MPISNPGDKLSYTELTAIEKHNANDNVFEDWDLSAYPASVFEIACILEATGAAASVIYGRMNGSGDDRQIAKISSHASNFHNAVSFHVNPDTSGIIELKVNTGKAICLFRALGYWS
jgi:hypothetical protein